MPRVMPFYAVKSNPDVNILRTLKMLGAGFDCASEAELDAVKKLGQQSGNRAMSYLKEIDLFLLKTT